MSLGSQKSEVRSQGSALSFARSFDFALVRRLVIDPGGYRAAGDDFAGPPEEFVVNEDSRIWYVLVRDGGELLGAFLFLPQSSVCFEVHLALLPVARGRSSAALRGAIAWMFAASAARRIVGAVPAFNRLANQCARAAGMTRYGTNFKSFLKGGVLHDMTLWGISKG